MSLEHNKGFRHALEYISKHAYMTNSSKKLQADITELKHWLDDNRQADRKTLLDKLAEVLRKYVKSTEPRY